MLTSAALRSPRKAHGRHVWRVRPAAAGLPAGGACGGGALRPGRGEHSGASVARRGGLAAGGGGPRQQPGQGEATDAVLASCRASAAALLWVPWATRRLTQRAVAGHRGAHLERHRVRRGAPVRVQLLPGASRAVDGVCRDATPEPALDPCPNARPVRGRRAPRRPGPVQAHREGHGRLVVPHPGPGRWRRHALCGRPRPGTPTNTPALLLPRHL